jgi:hypothetical protein
VADLGDEVAAWLAERREPYNTPLPRTRSTEQWIAWLRAEGFIEEIESPYHYWPVSDTCPYTIDSIRTFRDAQGNVHYW